MSDSFSPLNFYTQSDRPLPGLNPEHLQRLLLASHSLSSTLDLQEVLDRVLDAAAELTESDGASILLIDHKSGDLRFVAIKGAANLVNVIVPKNNSLAGWVVTNDEPIISQNAQDDKRHYKTLEQTSGTEIDSVLAVPLRHKGEVLGVLETVNKQGGQLYTDYDIAVVQSLSSQAAVAITNARLFNQSDAIADMMHELKTPLMALTMATEMLDRPTLSDADRTHLIDTIRSEIQRLTKMTQDFLELSRLDSGRISLEPVSLNPVELSELALRTMQPQAKQAGIRLDLVNHLESPPPTIIGDRHRLQQVLINLISNAIKYNQPKGSVTVELCRQEDAIAIAIVDTGLGIAPDDLTHLFERFYRVKKNSKAKEGTGLGLSIAKKIVEAHRGRMEVESEVGKGSTFRCILPIESK